MGGEVNTIKDLSKMAEIYGGLLLLNAMDDSPCSRAGIQAGDIILTINQYEIKTLDDYVKSSDGSSRRIVSFIRDGKKYVTTMYFDRKEICTPVVNENFQLPKVMN